MEKTPQEIEEATLRSFDKAMRNAKILPASAFTAKSNKRDSLSETIKTQEQADFLMRQLRWLIRDAEEREQQQQKEK